MTSSPARADDVNSKNSSRSIDPRTPISQEDQIANDLPSNIKTPTVPDGSAPTPPTKLLPINLRSNSPDRLDPPNAPSHLALPQPISDAETNSAIQGMLSAAANFTTIVRGKAPTAPPDSVSGTPTLTDPPEQPLAPAPKSCSAYADSSTNPPKAGTLPAQELTRSSAILPTFVQTSTPPKHAPSALMQIQAHAQAQHRRAGALLYCSKCACTCK